MAKIPRTYRLDLKTINQISWLGKVMSGISDTDVIVTAVDELYQRKQAEGVAVLRDLGDGSYDLLLGQTLMLAVGEATVRQIPEEIVTKLLGVGCSAKQVLPLFYLAAAKAGEQIIEYSEAFAKFSEGGDRFGGVG
ncbi:MAG: hypothetical protein JXB85_12675 [Anaerolineales bacterium]|nr:hypothetical protein [Anaerolineales bacterium]